MTRFILISLGIFFFIFNCPVHAEVSDSGWFNVKNNHISLKAANEYYNKKQLQSGNETIIDKLSQKVRKSKSNSPMISCNWLFFKDWWDRNRL